MEFTATQIASLINGKIEGDPDVTVSSFGKTEEAQEGQLAFLANPKYEEFLYSTKASIIIINDTQEVEQKVRCNTYSGTRCLFCFCNYFKQLCRKWRRHNLPEFSNPFIFLQLPRLGENVFIGAFTYIGENVKIGNNVKLFPQVYIGDNAIY